jgi:superfamily II DNA or RNA helicase
VCRRLTFGNPRTGTTLHAYQQTAHHWLTPRNFLSPEHIEARGIELVDARNVEFPAANLVSRVTLDAKEPSKTHQRESVKALLGTTMDAILCLRCGAGKSPTSLHAAAQLKVPILVIVDDVGLARQWIREIQWVFGITPNDIGKCYDSKFDWKYDITIATVQTLANRVRAGELPYEMTDHFGVVIMDEAHVMGAPYFSTAIPPFAGRRWALTATPRRGDDFDPLLRHLVGDIVFTYLEPDLRPEVIFRRLNTRIDFADHNVQSMTHDASGELHLAMLYAYFSTLEDRTSKIVKDVQQAVDAGRSCLVLTHSRNMCELLESRFEHGGSTHGGVKGDRHFQIVKESNPLIAIMKRGKQALDKEEVDTVFVLEPFVKQEVLQQVMGRALRTYANKRAPKIIIYEDVLIHRIEKMCNKLRATLSRWPDNQGGKINYTTQKPI